MNVQFLLSMAAAEAAFMTLMVQIGAPVDEHHATVLLDCEIVCEWGLSPGMRNGRGEPDAA